MTTFECDEFFDDLEWVEAMRFLPALSSHPDFWNMYCMGGEL